MKKVICVDLDGVLAEHDGWRGVDYFGDPIPGAKEFLQSLSEHYDIIIYTCRCTEGINRSEKACLLKNRVTEWLDENDMKYDHIFTGQGKPIASYYIDDRGIRCVPEIDKDAYQKVLDVVMKDDYIEMK